MWSPTTDPEEAYAQVVRAGMVEPLTVEAGPFDVSANSTSYTISGTADRNIWLRSLEVPRGEEIEKFECGDVVWSGAQLSRDGTRLVCGPNGAFEYVPVPDAYNLWARFLPMGAVWRVHLRPQPVARPVTLRLHGDGLTPRVQQRVMQMQLLHAAAGSRSA